MKNIDKYNKCKLELVDITQQLIEQLERVNLKLDSGGELESMIARFVADARLCVVMLAGRAADRLGLLVSAGLMSEINCRFSRGDIAAQALAALELAHGALGAINFEGKEALSDDN